MSGPACEGRVDPGFEPVAEAFLRNFSDHGDVGAAVCVYRDGRPVVDIWAGVADPDTGRPWGPDSVVTVFSVTKGLTAVMANLLIEEGRLDPDAPVAAYWPEFAAAGKQDIPVRWLLSHRAGLPHVEGTFTLTEALSWEPVVRALAAEAPQWEPGSRHGYHMRSYGWLVGEVIRRVTGRSPGRFWAERVAGPLGLSTWIGTPVAEQARCARLIPPEPTGVDLAQLLGADSLSARVFTGPSGLFHYDEMWNTAQLRSAELPSSGGISDARSLARVYAACLGPVDGHRLLRPETVDRATEVQARGPDAVLFIETCFGLGFTLPPMLAPACGPASFGHGGAGGSLAFADPQSGLSLGYVMNRMRLDLEDTRAADLAAAAYSCL